MDNSSMSTETNDTAADPQEQGDFEAVLRHAFEGEPLDPKVARRVDLRAHRITERIRRVHGVIDDETFQELLRDDDDP